MTITKITNIDYSNSILNYLSDMVIDKNLEKICKMVDEYNNSIREDRKENGYKQEE